MSDKSKKKKKRGAFHGSARGGERHFQEEGQQQELATNEERKMRGQAPIEKLKEKEKKDEIKNEKNEQAKGK